MTTVRLDTKNQLIVFARRTRLIIRWSALGVALLFSWLRFRGVEVLPVVRGLPAILLLRGALVFYYFSWLFGATFDTDMQEVVYASAPNRRGKIPAAAIAAVGAIVVVFAVLCAISSFEQFLLFLLVFWLVNVIAWRYLAGRFLPPIIRSSSLHFHETGDFAKLDQMAFLRIYLTGRWQWIRFTVGCALLVVLNVTAQTDFSSAIAARVGMAKDTILAIGVAAFLLVVEGWIWIRRLQTRAAIATIERLHHRYQNTRRRSGAAET